MLTLRVTALAASALLVAPTLLTVILAEEVKKPPLSSGYVEEVESALVLLDMRVKNRKGEPVRGLEKDDFEVSVDGHVWAVEAVDDFCACGSSSSAGGVTPGVLETMAPEGSPGTEPSQSPAENRSREPFRFVLFLDYKQLDSGFRVKTAREARRWVNEVLQDGDLAMVVASGLALKELTPLTADATVLTNAINASASDPEMDDAYPRMRWLRQKECKECVGRCLRENRPPQSCPTMCYFECEGNAIQERQHSGQALTALRLILQRLGKIEGRKQLVYFNASGTLFPSRLYGSAREFTVGDQLPDAEEVGAAATASRTAIFAPGWAWSDLNANLGDFSGGGTLAELEAEVERGCSCVYRIALKPRGKRGRVHQIRVHVPRAQQTVFFRSVTPTKRDRWLGEVHLALMSPTLARSIPLSVSLVPLAFDGHRWTVAVELAFEMDALLRLPGVGSARAEWGAGVFLTQNRNRREWALEAFAAAEIGSGRATRAGVLHRSVLEMRPGDYSAAAYVGDLSAETVGGAATTLQLPNAQEAAIVGPVLSRAPARVLLLELPEEGEESGIEGSQVEIAASAIVPGSLRAGDALVAVSWLCPGEEEAKFEAVWRYLSRNGEPLFRLEGPPPARVDGGPCYRVEDTFELPADIGLEASYTYNIRWSAAQLESTAPITID